MQIFIIASKSLIIIIVWKSDVWVECFVLALLLLFRTHYIGQRSLRSNVLRKWTNKDIKGIITYIPDALFVFVMSFDSSNRGLGHDYLALRHDIILTTWIQFIIMKNEFQLSEIA